MLCAPGQPRHRARRPPARRRRRRRGRDGRGGRARGRRPRGRGARGAAGRRPGRPAGRARHRGLRAHRARSPSSRAPRRSPRRSWRPREWPRRRGARSAPSRTGWRPSSATRSCSSSTASPPARAWSSPRTRREAREALEAFLVQERFGAGRVVVEEALEGEELSLLALCDGETAVPMAPAQDYKRIFDGDRGPNTGGMGSYSPVPGIDRARLEEMVRTIHQPVVDELRHRGTPFHGCLYAGLMLTAAGPRVLEFNVRFGDPETQAVLPRLRSDLLDLLQRSTGARRPGRRRPRVGRALGGERRARLRRLSGVDLPGRRDQRARRGARRRRGHPRRHRLGAAAGRSSPRAGASSTSPRWATARLPPATPPMLPPT